MEKKCYTCKQELNINHFIDNDKVLSKCNICRTKKITNKCEICGVRAKYNYKDQKLGIRCSSHKEEGMINVKSHKCILCKKIEPNYNFQGEKKPLYCVTCKKDNMVDVKNPKCILCDLAQPAYNKKGKTIALYCAKCKSPEMINVKIHPCIICKIKCPSFNYQGEKKALYCFECANSDMINLKKPKCVACKLNYPLFNNPNETIGLYCSSCKKENMIDVFHPKCIICGIKNPSFNKDGETKALYCGSCKTNDMIRITYKPLCIICKLKSPSFNKPGEIKALYCFSCKDNTMINVVSRRCIICKIRYPSFNIKGETKALYCVSCKTENMVDLKHSKCVICKNKYPNFNTEDEGIPLYCRTCKKPNMIDVRCKRCKVCKKQAYYALPGVSPEYCAVHRSDGMIKNPRKKCIISNCNEIATHGLIKTEHCEHHSLPDEYNFAERTCPKCGKIDILNKDGICVNTCSILEMDNAIKKRKKRHEEYVGKLINQHIDTTNIIQTWNDEAIDTSCTRQRPDFVFHCGTHVVIVEVDEEQHKSYKSCGNTKEEMYKTEARRMYNIGNVFIGIPVTFIRFNPDKYKDKNGNSVKISTTKRHDILIKWLKKCIKNDISSGSSGPSKLRVKYLFYDGYEESDGTFIDITEKDVL